jgi:hypothetical protein
MTGENRQVFVDDFSGEFAQAEALYERPSLTVFVGRRTRRGSTDVMAGARDKVWFRAVHCVGGDHAKRAESYVTTYRARWART